MVMIFASFVSSIEVSSLFKFSVHHFIPEFMSKAFHLQSTGSFLATARYGSATPVPPSILSRGIGWLVCCNKCYFSYMVFFASELVRWVGAPLDHKGDLLLILSKWVALVCVDPLMLFLVDSSDRLFISNVL